MSHDFKADSYENTGVEVEVIVSACAIIHFLPVHYLAYYTM